MFCEVDEDASDNSEEKIQDDVGCRNDKPDPFDVCGNEDENVGMDLSKDEEHAADVLDGVGDAGDDGDKGKYYCPSVHDECFIECHDGEHECDDVGEYECEV